jgi:hypothetical protein
LANVSRNRILNIDTSEAGTKTTWATIALTGIAHYLHFASLPECNEMVRAEISHRYGKIDGAGPDGSGGRNYILIIDARK